MSKSRSRIPMQPTLFWAAIIANVVAAVLNGVAFVVTGSPMALVGLVHVVVLAVFPFVFTPRRAAPKATTTIRVPSDDALDEYLRRLPRELERRNDVNRHRP